MSGPRAGRYLLGVLIVGTGSERTGGVVGGSKVLTFLEVARFGLVFGTKSWWWWARCS